MDSRGRNLAARLKSEAENSSTTRFVPLPSRSIMSRRLRRGLARTERDYVALSHAALLCQVSWQANATTLRSGFTFRPSRAMMTSAAGSPSVSHG